MSTISTDNAYENARNIYTGLNLIDNHVYSTLKPTSNPIPEAQKTAKTRYCCAPYKLATVCLGLLCALLMIYTLYVTFKACKQCPQGFVLRNSHCYYFSTGNTSWDDSRKDCKARGADLVVIETEEEQVFIHKHCRRHYWIGLTDSVNTWLWVDKSQLDVSLSYWRPGEPNHYRGKEHCVHGLSHLDALKCWNDIHCDANCHWVCEKPLK